MSNIRTVDDMKSCGEIKEPPPMSYISNGELIEFVGYQFYDLKGRLSRIYATKTTDTSELFCVTFYPKLTHRNPSNYNEFFTTGIDHWEFAGGMSPVEYNAGKEIARKTYLANLNNDRTVQSDYLAYYS